jgi:hypothetical protein
MRHVFIALIGGGILLAPAKARESLGPLDQPLAKETVTLPADKEHAKGLVRTCYRFAGFVIRAERETGNWADQYTVVPPSKDRQACRHPAKSELHIGVWSRLLGVKDRYVFFASKYQGAETTNYGVKSNRSANTLFEESTASDFAVADAGPGRFVLRYRREYVADCSLYYGAATECWGKVKAATGLTDAMLPDCRAAYEREKKKRDVAEIVSYPAQLSYNAEARWRGGKLTYAARPGPVACGPE